MGESGERRMDWNFNRVPHTLQVLVESELGTGGTPKVAWALRIRRELEEGWTTCYTNGSGLDDKAAGVYTRK